MGMMATALSAGLSLVGSLVSASAQMAAAEAQAQQAQMQANYQAEVARREAEMSARNQKIAFDNAQKKTFEYAAAGEDIDMQNRALLAEQVAVQGASGLGLSSHSFFRTRSGTRRLANTERLRTAMMGAEEVQSTIRQSDDFGREGYNLRLDADFAERSGAATAASIRAGGRANATASIIGGFTNFGQSILGGLR